MYRQQYVDELLRRDGRGAYTGLSCKGCRAHQGIIRCRDCFGTHLSCAECIVQEHRHLPFHRLLVGYHSFVRSSYTYQMSRGGQVHILKTYNCMTLASKSCWVTKMECVRALAPLSTISQSWTYWVFTYSLYLSAIAMVILIYTCSFCALDGSLPHLNGLATPSHLAAWKHFSFSTCKGSYLCMTFARSSTRYQMLLC